MSTRRKIDEIKLKMEDVHEHYGVDQRELGKLMVVVSTTLLIVSAHAALSFKEAADSMESVNNELDTVSGIVNSQNFQQALDVISSLNSQSISSQVNTFVSAFQGLEKSIKDSNQVERRLRDKYRLYQWLALVAIMGEVAGFSIIYL
ncbi:MAG: hypothetical protein ABEJ91_01115 [Candidatus Nanohaloarchaea archaeon]